MRKLCLVAVLVAGALASAGAAWAGGGDNIVIANNTVGGTMTRSNVLVSPSAAPGITSTNLALANNFACTGCNTYAVAMQAVLITGAATSITPTNAAVADNGGCVGCIAYAFAAQYVVTTGGPVYLSSDAQQQVSAIRSEAAADAASGIPLDLLTTELDGLFAQLKNVINTELQQAGRPANGTDSVSVDPIGG